MIKRTKLIIGLLAAVIFCFAKPTVGFGGALCEVVSPKRFETLHAFPVHIAVRFNEGAKPETFRSWLNGREVTGRFAKTHYGMEAFVDLRDGLSLQVRSEPQKQINLLRATLEGPKREQDVDIQVPFVLEVEKVITVGVAGGDVRSADQRLSVKIPPDALSSETVVTITKIRTSSAFGDAYEVAPQGLHLGRPAVVSLEYDPRQLPTGVWEDDLFLVLGSDPPKKMEDLSLDKAHGRVQASACSFDAIALSYYQKTGLFLSDVPFASDFRVPFGNKADAPYGCGVDSDTSSESDVGDKLGLISRATFPNSDYPRISFNENGQGTPWAATTAFHRTRSAGTGFFSTLSLPAPDRESWFSDGEDWVPEGEAGAVGNVPIRAIAAGVVIYNGFSLGSTIVLAHRTAAGPVLSFYSHLREQPTCRVGTAVRKGSVIGKIGPVGTDQAYLHYGIGKESLVKFDVEKGEIKVPVPWVQEWTQDAVYEDYYDPTNFLINASGKYRWGFEVKGNDEGWMVHNGKKREDGYAYEVRNGLLSFAPENSASTLTSYPLALSAAGFDSVFLSMRTRAVKGRGRVLFITGDQPAYAAEKGVDFEITDDNAFHDYRVFMADHSDWRGTVIGIRIAFEEATVGENGEVDLDGIRFGRGYLSSMPDTGQTSCFDNTREIPCPSEGAPFHGQDADYVSGNPSYEVQSVEGEEIVVDHVTRLSWQRGDSGKKREWREAVDHCESLQWAGYSDWRLPTKKELQTILGFNRFGPAIDTDYFSYTHPSEDLTWSSTRLPAKRKYTWGISFWDGQTRSIPNETLCQVVAVRGRPLDFGQFLDHGDGAVTDMTTGLMWAQGESEAMTWEKALAYCEGLASGGYSDWRLPNVRELLTLVDDTRVGPSADAVYFPGCKPSPYWSGTTHAAYPGFAWYVEFGEGRPFGGGQKGRRYYVRPVRTDR